MENIIADNLENLGKKYKTEHLDRWKDNVLISNHWESLKFFFSHSFMRGRRDKLSVEYYEFTLCVLSDYFEIEKEGLLSNNLIRDYNQDLFNTDKCRKLKNGKSNSLTHPNFEIKIRQNNALIYNLTQSKLIEIEFPTGNYYKKNICIQNDADLFMVLDTLNFISQSPNKINLYNYFKGLIQNKKASVAYSELNTISGVGDKISSFILRDIILINDYEIKSDELKYVFPVDTWVAQIASILAKRQFSTNNANDIKDYFSKNFPARNLPLIAAGIWYLGFNSLSLTIDYLTTKKIVEN